MHKTENIIKLWKRLLFLNDKLFLLQSAFLLANNTKSLPLYRIGYTGTKLLLLFAVPDPEETRFLVLVGGESFNELFICLLLLLLLLLIFASILS